MAASKNAPKKVKVSRPKNGVQYTQAELYENIREACEFDNRRIARDVYDAFAQFIAGGLKKGYKIPLPGIGKIQVRQSKARLGRNPMTGETIKIPARKRIRLTPSKALKQAVL